MNKPRKASGHLDSPNMSISQIRAIAKSRKLAAVIIRDYPQASSDYKNGLTCRQIAVKHLDDKSRVAEVAVGHALKTLIPDEEERRMLREEKQIRFGKMSPELSEEGLRSLRRSMQSVLMQRGRKPWITNLVEPETGLNEDQYLLSLVEQQGYIRKGGSRKGHPDCFKIAEKLNATFHEGENVRSAKAISTRIARLNDKEY